MQTTTAAQFGEVVAAYAAATSAADIRATSDALKAITPPGIMLRPNHTGKLVHIHRAEEPGVAFATFYLTPHHKRARDPELVRLTWAAIQALGAAVAPPAEIAPGEFSRAKLAGYDVEPNGFGEGWFARDPEGDDVPPQEGDYYPTERAAWEACDGHRMFGGRPA